MIKILKEFSKKEVWLMLICIILIVGQVRIDLKLPEYMWKITELIETEGTQIQEIVHQWIQMLSITLISVLISMVLVFCSSKIAANFSAKLRARIYDKVQSFSMENVKNFSIASLITRETNDVVQVQSAIVQSIQIFVKAPILATWALIKILDKNPMWSVATGVAIWLLIIIATVALILVIPKFRIIQKLVDKVNNVSREHINWIRVVRAYNAEKYQEEKFDKANKNLTNTQMFTWRAMSFLMPSVDVIMNLLHVAVYFLGWVIIMQTALDARLWIFSDMMVFSSYATQLVMSFIMLVFVLVILPWALVSARRIAEVLKTESNIKDWIFDKKTEKKWEVEFKHVNFKYPDAEEYVIEDITFTAKEWEIVALIWATWCGKSTIVNLIPRFYDATDWEILIDWVEIKKYKQKTLRDKIWYISQSAFLFKWDIRENILFGMDGSDDEALKLASKVSESDEFIKKLDDWYDHFVALWWTNFSWWQKQRLSIARAIARKPEILIFDDSFSALDYKTDLKLRKNLNKLLKWSTIFIVAQRIGTIKNADKILVIEDWKCVWIWKHEELLQNCKVYKEIALSQLSEQELNSQK